MLLYLPLDVYVWNNKPEAWGKEGKGDAGTFPITHD